MRWLVYNLLFAIGYTLMLPHFLLRMRRRGGYREHFAERFGRYDDAVAAALGALAAGGGAVWVHAVSVGEIYVAGQLMAAWRRRAPTARFVLSTTSSTGRREAEKLAQPGDVVIYCPLDFPVHVRRALDRIRPTALILTESELWPNLIRTCARRGVPVALVNGRVSDRSAPGYRRLRFWFGPVLRSLRLLLVQSALDRDRLLAAGADAARLEVTGSFKYDVARRQPDKEALAAAVLCTAGIRPGTHTVLLGGSTWPGEEAILLALYRRLLAERPSLRLVLLPRHFERGDAVAAEIARYGCGCVRRSRLTPGAPPPADPAPGAPPPVLLVDSTGESMGFYAQADLVFVGKSLTEHGAQNMIEPCLCGKAVLVGPNTENFRPVMADLQAADAIRVVPDAAGLETTVRDLLADPEARAALGARAAAAVESRRGVVDRCLARLQALA